jgi:aerobic-type carbon monoxide dehydrogenase small subunit (CoxS/CutS family)
MASDENISCMVNGQPVSLPAVPGEMLADLLRQRLGLTGVKIGCNEAECGACTVLVDGEPVLSCTYPAQRAHGKTVLTIEGLAAVVNPEAGSQAGLHPLQEAFIQHGAVQCGFCIPGQIMTAYALLRRTPDPSGAEIRQALKGSLCRCGGYPTMERAILAASQAMRSGEALSGPDVPESAHARQVVGRLRPRPEVQAKVTGKALYTDDLSFEGMLHGRAKRAMVAHARLISLDVEPARRLQGVRAVLTAADIPGEHNHGLVIRDWPSLVGVGERVRTVGDAIALVAADTREVASQALELIEAEFELLPVISDPQQALQPEAEALHPGGNLLKHIKVRKGDTSRGLAEADVVIEHTFHTPSTDHLFI